MTGRILHIVLAAGGTGGHMFPAQALCDELVRRGHRVTLISDKRGLQYPGLFQDIETRLVDSESMSRGGLLHKIRTLFSILTGLRKARRILRGLAPDAVVGFGGYPALPTILAARLIGIPYCIHEQNAVLGRVNRFVARKASAIALSFKDTRYLPRTARLGARVTGNPVRQDIVALSKTPYPRLDEDALIRILVTGGSQGARILSDVVPDALSLIPRGIQSRLQVTQQCRPEDVERVRQKYENAGIAAEIFTFLEDIPGRLQWTHLVIARAGASTMAELTTAGRPAILIPLAIAADDHQTVNAKGMVDAGGAWAIAEKDFTAASLAKRLQRLFNNPADLIKAAKHAHRIGMPDAAASLANLVEKAVRDHRKNEIESGASAESTLPDDPTSERVAA